MEFLLAVKTLYPAQMSLNHDRYLKTLPTERRVPTKILFGVGGICQMRFGGTGKARITIWSSVLWGWSDSNRRPPAPEAGIIPS